MDESLSFQPLERDSRLVAAAAQTADLIATEIGEQHSSVLLERYLQVAGRFAHRSLYNQLLITLQAPGASLIKSHEEWANLGYLPAHGQRAIRLLGRHTFRDVDETSGEVSEHEATVSTPCFDVSQLAPELIAIRPIDDELYEVSPLAGLSPEMRLAQIEAAVRSSGINIIESSEPERIDARSTIALQPGLAPDVKVLMILFSYAKRFTAFGPSGERLEPVTQEGLAAAATFSLAQHIGIRARFAPSALPAFGPDGSSLLSQLELVRKASGRMLRTLESSQPQEEGAHLHRSEDHQVQR